MLCRSLCRLPGVLGLLVFSVMLVARTADADAPVLKQVMQRDAQLHDLAFVDARHGWAVGDRGVILRTEDGGRRWQLIESGVECPLYAVDFINARVGWAVGGFATPYSHTSHAVVLKTENGGMTWKALPADTLPLLRSVQFFDERTGVVTGAGTAFSPSGLLETRDGGRTWRPMPTNELAHWTAAHFLSPGNGLLGGDAGQLATVMQRDVRQVETLTGNPRGVRDVRLIPPGGGWLVGDGGLVLATTDRGTNWLPPAGSVPAACEQTCDWKAISVHGPRVWITGTPGSVVLHSPDAGRSWQLQPTGVQVPLTAVTFVDAQHGWAAGALGTIVVTENGGRTWRVQRRSGQHTATLVLTTSLSDVPLELLATTAGAEGYLTAVDLIFAPESDLPAESEARLREAILASGASLASVDWRLALSEDDRQLDRDALLGQLNQRTGGRAMQLLERTIATRIRTLKPETVLLARQQLDKTTGAEQLLAEVVARAVQLAANPEQFPELAECSIDPHQPRGVVAVAPVNGRRASRVVTGDFESLLGTSPAHWVGSARGLLTRRYTPAPSAVGWSVVSTNNKSLGHGRTPMAGIILSRGGEARRAATAAAAGELAALRDNAQKQRHMRALLTRQASIASAADNQAWRSQVLGLTSGLDHDSGAELLYELANGYRTAGQLDQAADTYYMLARRYTDHPLTESSLLWLLRYYASSEVAHAATLPIPVTDPTQPLANVTANQPAANVLPLDERLERAAQLGTYFEQARPALFADPAVRLPIAAAERGLGHQSRAERQIVVLTNRAIAPDWRRAARAERSLRSEKPIAQSSSNNATAEKPIATIRRTAERPLLDGLHDEPVWQAATVLRVGQANVRLACDEEFLYIAIDANRAAGVDDAPAEGPRQRDADLSQRDHLTLSFDIDRDYTTALELSIDSAGRAADHCWGNQPWNPQWYIAAAQSSDRWTAEAAIPLAQLTSNPPESGTTWALALRRTTPGQATKTWTGSNTISPDRFGLLRFE